jgi:hypothetical protein
MTEMARFAGNGFYSGNDDHVLPCFPWAARV